VCKVHRESNGEVGRHDGMDATQKQKRIDELTAEEKQVTQEGGTEAPFSGAYWNKKDDGTYRCKVCGAPLFSSETKFVTTIPGLAGWPSFEKAIPGSIEYKPDVSLGMKRTEVVCKNCGAHLGHVFDEKEESKSGTHFCINSCSLDFDEKA
jgi:peptide-methionine (R)-S-oxide reductase